MSLKRTIVYIIRKAWVAPVADIVRFNFKKIWNLKKNNLYKKTHADVMLPPDYFVYETYKLNHEDYIKDGHKTATEIIEVIDTYSNLNVSGNRILDWGCGPARVIRHFPMISQNKLTAFGTDYNSEYVKWNLKNIRNVTFKENKIDPPIDFEENYFAVIYGLSILTHLSAENHFSWIKEMYRLLKPNGILILSTQGDVYKNKLTKAENILFSKGILVTRSQAKEGTRIFSAFHPEAFMQNLFTGFEIVMHQRGNEPNNIAGFQDTWVVKKL